MWKKRGASVCASVCAMGAPTTVCACFCFFFGFCSKPQANDLRAHLMWNGKRKCQSEILKLQRAEEEELDKEFCACVQNKHKV